MALLSQTMGMQRGPVTVEEQIIQAYQQYLGREPSQQEILSQTGNGQFKMGDPRIQMSIQNISRSPEAQARQTGQAVSYGQEPPVSSGPIRKTGGEISDSTKKIVELSMEYQKMFPGPVNQDHQSRWFADRGAPIGHLTGGMPGGEKPTLQPGYTPPREGGFTGTTIPAPGDNKFLNPQLERPNGSPWANIDPRESIGFRLPSQGLWSKPAQSSGGYLQALNPTGAYGASNSWDAISKGVTNLAGSMNKSANTSGYTKPRSSISLDPQPADPWTRPTRKQW